MPDFADLFWTDGQNNAPGVKKVGYLIPVADIDIFPALPDAPATMEESVTISSNLVMNLDKYAIAVEGTEADGEVADASVGGEDNSAFESTFEFYISGTKPAALATIKKIKNTHCVFIPIEFNGQRRLLGTKDNPVVVDTIEATSGKQGDDKKGIQVTVKSYQDGPAPVYTGSIPTASGSI